MILGVCNLISGDRLDVPLPTYPYGKSLYIWNLRLIYQVTIDPWFHIYIYIYIYTELEDKGMVFGVQLLDFGCTGMSMVLSNWIITPI